MNLVIALLIGLAAGGYSGFFGLGGGLIIVPALVYLLNLTQHQAQGTSLAILLLPIGLLGVIKYYTQGNVVLNLAIFIALGFLIGAYAGASFAHLVPGLMLRKLFGVFILLVALRMIIWG